MAAKERKKHKKRFQRRAKVSNAKSRLFLRLLRFFAAIKSQDGVSLRLSVASGA